MLCMYSSPNQGITKEGGNGRGPRTYSELTRLSVADRATYFANHPSRPNFEPNTLLDNLYGHRHIFLTILYYICTTSRAANR